MKKVIFFSLLIILIAGISHGLFADETSSLQTFQEVLYLIRNYHVEEQDIDQLIEGAIKGLVDTVDPYSTYLNPEEYKEMQQEFEGHFGGIGIVITTKDGQLTIVNPIEGTPGERVGLKTGDKIIEVDGHPTSEMTQDKAVRMMRGEPGTPVELTIQRDGAEELLKFKIIRSDIEVPYVEYEMKTDEIGYIIISQFVQDVGNKVEGAIQELKNQGAKGIILELRNNPGGLLNEAIKVVSNFIPQGKVVSIRQRDGKETVLYTDPTINTVNLPLVVLVNEWSASASEIVAGAIKDHNRGKIIGTKTFGKGTVQTVIPLSNGSALKLTTARYYTPSNNYIHEKGIEPDILVEYNPEYKGEHDNQLEEAINFLETLFIVNETLENAS